MMLPEEDSISYLPLFSAYPAGRCGNLRIDSMIGPKTKWAAFMDEVDADCESRQRAYQDEMRRG